MSESKIGGWREDYLNDMEISEAKMFDSRLEGNYDLHDRVHTPPPGTDGHSFRKVSDVGKNRVLGARLHPGITISDNSSEVFTAKFSPDGKLLAAGCGDSAIKVFNVSTGRLAYSIQNGSAQALPVTAMQFRPAMSQSKTRNVLVTVDAGGKIQHWHITSGKCLNSIAEEDQFYALDYRRDGSVFAASGKNHTVRIYDETTKHEVMILQGGTGYGTSSTPGHSNRVFALRFHHDDPEVLLTGGWDNTVQFWDMRVRHSVRSIFGPHLSGDALDVCGNQVLTGSWRPKDPLEIWDYGTGQLVETVPWNRSGSQGSQQTLLYAAQFSSKEEGGKYIAAGGSGANEAKIFDHKAGNQLVGTVTGLSRGVFTIDFSPADKPKKVAVAGGDASIRIIDIIEDKVEEMR